MIKLIVFDWDDVFTVGSKEGYIRCLHEAVQTVGVVLDPEEERRRILSAWSKPHREELRALLKEYPEKLDKACGIYEEKFFGSTFIDNLSLVAGSNELLTLLKDKYILAIATGAHPIMLKEKVMPKFKVPQVFSQIMFGYEIDDLEKQKPHPYMLEEIMRIQAVLPSETIFVGDARSDVQMARDAGVDPVVVLTGHLNRKEAESLGVRHIIDNVSLLGDVLKTVV